MIGGGDVLASIALGALLVAMWVAVIRRFTRNEHDRLLPYSVQLARWRYDRHVEVVKAREDEELAEYIRRRNAGNALRKQFLALWTTDMKDRRPSRARPRSPGGVTRLVREPRNTTSGAAREVRRV